VTISGLLSTDTYPLNIQYKRYGTVIDNPIVAGTYTATITNQSNDNYVINDNYETTFVIAKKELNFTWNNTSFVYNSQIQKPDAVISGLLGTDTFSLNIEYIINDATVENPISAGTYKAMLTNPSDEKYIINGNQEINFTINKADINITMSNLTAKFSDDLLDITNAYSLTGTIYNDELVVSAFTNAIPHVSGTYILSVNTNSNSNYNVTINSGTYTIQNGSVITYQLPNGETETYYLDNGEATPSLNSIYTPDLFSVLSVELIDDENNHAIYKITEISFLPVIIVCSGLLLVVMLFLISILAKRKRWRS
jgi:hypothetical protein